jgi:hypothetical protein
MVEMSSLEAVSLWYLTRIEERFLVKQTAHLFQPSSNVLQTIRP